MYFILVKTINVIVVVFEDVFSQKFIQEKVFSPF